MTDVVDAIDAVTGAVFTSNETAKGSSETDHATWAAGTGAACCSVIVGKLNADPTKAGIASAFQNSSTYIGSSSSSGKNRLRAIYTIPDSEISAGDHTSLQELTTALRTSEVAKQITSHYTSEGKIGFEITRISYTHDSGSNKALKLTMTRFKPV